MKGENPIRIRMLELLADSEALDEKELYIEDVSRATVRYHLDQLSRLGLIIRKEGRTSLSPHGMAYYLRLLDEGLAIAPKKFRWRVGVWTTRPLTHIIFTTTILLLYWVLKERAVLVFHITNGPFLFSLSSFAMYILITSIFIVLHAKAFIFPANYAGLVLIALFAFLPLDGPYRLGYALAQTTSLILCSEILYRATRIGRYRTLAMNFFVYLAGLILHW